MGTSGNGEAHAHDLTEVLRAAAEEHGTPGASVGVLVGGEAIVASYGVTSVEHPCPIGPDTLFQVGSITKTFTAAAVMLLVEEGRLALEDPVARFLPALGPATALDLDAITVEDLLAHRAGFDGDHLFVQRVTDDLTALRGARRLFPPGTGFSYCNAGFSIAGAVIEAITGRAFEQVLHERLLRPLGMATAGFRADEVITSPVALPHWVHQGRAHLLRGAGWQPGWELGAVDRPAGGLVASAAHLLAWCAFQRTGSAPDGTPILSRTSLERLHAPVVEADAIEHIALDWFVRDRGGVTTFGHGGVTVGYVSDLVVVPERDLAFVGLTNGTNGASVNERVRRWVLREHAGIVEQDPEPDPSVPVDVTRWAGRYLSPFAVLDVSVPDDRTIVVTPSRRTDVDGWQPPVEPAMRCAPIAPDQVVTLDAPGPARTARFDRDDPERAAWLLWDHRRAPRIA